MLKCVLLVVVLGLARAAPAPDLRIDSLAKTPASTEKLTPLIAPLPALAVPRIALPLAFPPLAYAYVAPIKLEAVPSTYTVEQHGYTITY